MRSGWVFQNSIWKEVSTYSPDKLKRERKGGVEDFDPSSWKDRLAIYGVGKAVGGPDLGGKTRCDVLDRMNGDVK